MQTFAIFDRSPFCSQTFRYFGIDPLKVDRGELEETSSNQHLTNTYSDDLRHIPILVRRDIPVVPLPASMFSLASPSLEEVKRVIQGKDG